MAFVDGLVAHGSAHRISGGAWAPLRQARFRTVWLAGLVSNIGIWLQNVAASWLITQLSTSSHTVAWLQAAAGVPSLFAYPAAVLADMTDRRRVLLIAETWMLASVALLTALTLTGGISSVSLLVCTCALGLGGAASLPSWQAVIPSLVPRAELRNAVTLNGLSVNLARAVGPAIGGWTAATAGVGASFLVNVATLLYAWVVLWRLKVEQPATGQRPRFIAAALDGLRFAAATPALRSALFRVSAVSVFAGALWALLPLVARRVAGADSQGFGVLYAGLGIGAFAGALALPAARERVSSRGVLALGVGVLGVSLLALVHAHHVSAAVFVLLIGGVGWIATMSTLIVAVQESSPDGYRSRAMSLYVVLFQGGMGLSSFVWGWAGERLGLTAAMSIAGAGLLATIVLAFAWKSAPR